MTDIPRTTIQDRVRFYPLFDCNKHALSPDCDAYADERINQMTNCELLDAISVAFEEFMEEREDFV